MNEREARLVGDRVIAPDFRDGHCVLDAEASRDVDGGCRDVQMKRGANPAEMRPLRHRFEMVDRLGGFHFDDAFEALAFPRRREHQVRKHLPRADANASGLFFPHVRRHIVLTLELRLKKADDPVVLELLTDRPNQNWTQEASGEPGMVTYV